MRILSRFGIFYESHAACILRAWRTGEYGIQRWIAYCADVWWAGKAIVSVNTRCVRYHRQLGFEYQVGQVVLGLIFIFLGNRICSATPEPPCMIRPERHVCVVLDSMQVSRLVIDKEVIWGRVSCL